MTAGTLPAPLTVTLHLTEPVDAERAAHLGVEPDTVWDYAAGDRITLPYGSAVSLINAGFTTVDPADPFAVAHALTQNPAEHEAGEPEPATGPVAVEADTKAEPVARRPARRKPAPRR